MKAKIQIEVLNKNEAWVKIYSGYGKEVILTPKLSHEEAKDYAEQLCNSEIEIVEYR